MTFIFYNVPWKILGDSQKILALCRSCSTTTNFFCGSIAISVRYMCEICGMSKGWFSETDQVNDKNGFVILKSLVQKHKSYSEAGQFKKKARLSNDKTLKVWIPESFI